MARMALAAAQRRLGNDDAALLELRAAHSTLTQIGARQKAQEAADSCDGESRPAAVPPAMAPPAPSAPCVFRLDGDTRAVAYEGREVRLRDLKGMRYLALLLAEPAREFHVLELVSVERGVAPAAPSNSCAVPMAGPSDLGPVIDAQAKEAYRRRLDEIEEDIEEAVRLGDRERAALAEADRDYIVEELSRAFGLGARARVVGSTSERARASVTRAVRYALTRIAQHHPALAEHLQTTVRTGTYCSYAPDPRVPTSWSV